MALESVKVGGRAVAKHRSRIIVDSGTTLTFLDAALLGPLVEELSRRITLPRAESPEKLLQLCYDVSGAREGDKVVIPDVTLELGGGAAGGKHVRAGAGGNAVPGGGGDVGGAAGVDPRGHRAA